MSSKQEPANLIRVWSPTAKGPEASGPPETLEEKIRRLQRQVAVAREAGRRAPIEAVRALHEALAEQKEE